MNSKSELKIEFNKSAFATKSEVKEIEKPELKRFNMKFSQLDLKIIDYYFLKNDNVELFHQLNLIE